MRIVKAFLATLAAATLSFCQTTLTPNVQLQIPAYQQTNWQVPLIYDLNLLDGILGGTQVLTVGSMTPAVNTFPVFVTANTSSVTIANFTGAFQGQRITILCGASDNSTIINNSTNISVVSSFSCSPSATLSITLVLSGTKWIEVGRVSSTIVSPSIVGGATVNGQFTVNGDALSSAVSISSGSSSTTNGGSISVTGGSSSSANGGSITVTGGAANISTTGAGGNINLVGGTATTTIGNGGSINLTGGGSSGNAGGSIVLTPGGITAVIALSGLTKIGVNGTNITAVIFGNQTLTFTSISAQTCQEQTLTVGNATAGKATFFSPAASLGSTNLSWSSWVSATNTVSVRVCNPTTGAITPSAVIWNGWVQQ